MTAQKLDPLAIGETARYEITLSKVDGSPVDISALVGGDLTAAFRRYKFQDRGTESFFKAQLGNGLEFSNPIGSEEEPAAVILTIPQAESSAFVPQEVFWSIWATYDNEVFPVAYGTIEIIKI